MTTIAKNRARVLAAIKATVTTCKVFTLENNFHGAEVDQRHAWEALARHESAKLHEKQPGREWWVAVHDNWWYELYAEPADTGQTPNMHVEKADDNG